MKICSVCQQTYQDDSLNYCLNDGNILSFAGANPANLIASVEPQSRRSSSLLSLFGVGAIIAVLVIGGLTISAYLFIQKRNTGNVAVVEPQPEISPNSTSLERKPPAPPTSAKTVSNSSTNAAPEKPLSTQQQLVTLTANSVYVGAATNKTIKQSASISLKFNGNGNSIFATGRLSSGLFGRFENLPGYEMACDKAKPESSICMEFTGDLLLGNDGSGFPGGTKAPLTMRLAFSSDASRAQGEYEIGLIPKYESFGKQRGSISIKVK